ncbi:MAG: YceI family protein [Chloroflexota bacterium]|jgi:polyisoprenoid-binding protein YceI|nr:YceI family protein [Lentimicrobium sp.]
MKKQIINLIALIWVFLPLSLLAQHTYEVKSHSLVVAGTSNLHDWTANAEKVAGNFKLQVNNGKIASVNGVEIKVDAKSLKGSKGSIMDSKIEDALDAKKNPYISFKSNSGAVTEKAGSYKITANGVLTIAGVSQNITVDANGKVLPNGDVEFTGTKKLKMTDYKVDPPTAMLGTLTTGDDITLTFKVVLKTT